MIDPRDLIEVVEDASATIAERSGSPATTGLRSTDFRADEGTVGCEIDSQDISSERYMP